MVKQTKSIEHDKEEGHTRNFYIPNVAPCYILSASYGNDSIALIQWAHEQGLENCFVVYADTGWAHPDWLDRVKSGETLAESCGFTTWRVRSRLQFADWVEFKKMFPTNKHQWCTSYLKIIPFGEFLEFIDPLCTATVIVGKRRAESKSQESTQEFERHSKYYTDRTVWNPLYKHSDCKRNELIKKAGFEHLPHRSLECCPCVNANRKDLREAPEICLDRVRALEKTTGKFMYSTTRYMGASGIDEVMEWAASGRGRYNRVQARLWNYRGELCGSGMCGS